MPSSHLILCCPLLLLSSILPSIRVFSNELTLHMKWPKYWSFSFNTQDWSPLGWPGWIFLQSKGLSRVFYKSQLKRINSLALSFLYRPTLTSILDHWKNHSLDYMALCWQSNVSAFQYAIQIGHDKMKRQPINWKKIFANDMIDKGLIFKIYKQFIQLNNNNNKKNNKSNWKMNWLSEQTFSQRRYTDNKQAQEKKNSTLLIIRETQIKTMRTSLVAQW